MIIEVISENKISFKDKKQAEIELAFCHYPVVLRISESAGDKSEPLDYTFDSFDKARTFLTGLEQG